MTVVLTLLFGLFGLIPAYIHGNRAERMGGSSRPYWVAFGVSLVASAAAYVAVLLAVFAIFASAVSTSGAPNDSASEQDAAVDGWADAPEPGSCYMGVREEVEAFGGVEPGVSSGGRYSPIDCVDRSAFFVVSGVIDGITKQDREDSVCETFGSVYTSVWYNSEGEAEEGPVSTVGSLVCLQSR